MRCTSYARGIVKRETLYWTNPRFVRAESQRNGEIKPANESLVTTNDFTKHESTTDLHGDSLLSVRRNAKSRQEEFVFVTSKHLTKLLGNLHIS